MFLVAQLGARMHYAVPRLLMNAGILDRLYTDLYASRAFRSVLALPSQIGPAPLRRWLARTPHIPENRIVCFPTIAIEYYWRRCAGNSGAGTAAHLWMGRKFCERVVDCGLGSASAVYAFNSAGLELLRFARARGLLTVLEQTSAPSPVEDALLRQEQADHPAWVPARSDNPYRSAFEDRERMEWDAADLILCGSEFVRDGIRGAGGPAERCRVVPYGVSATTFNRTPEFERRPLRVLTVGAVGLQRLALCA